MFGSKQQEAVEEALSQGQEQAEQYLENPLADEVFGDEEEYQQESEGSDNAVKIADDAMNEGQNSGFFSYTVKKGDNLSLIALRALQDRFKWKLLANLNPHIRNPSLIMPGDLIKIPLNTEGARAFASNVKSGAAPSDGFARETVKTGDTLSAIAARVLGSASAWRMIWEHNKPQIANPHLIFAGQVIRIPNAAHKGMAH